MQTIESVATRVQQVTQGPLHHFFGYYDKCPWSQDGNYMLAMRNTFMDRNPTKDDALTVGLIDMQQPDTPFIPVSDTRAWNWQQGCMLRWLPPHEQDMLVFNDREGDRYVGHIHDFEGHRVRTLPYALYDIAPAGDIAATFSFERITDTRPGYGYFGLPDPRSTELQPDDDGLYTVDMKTGDRKLIFSIAQAGQYGEVRPNATDKAWFNHAKFNPTGSRLLFLHRWAREAVPGHRGFQTRLFTINPDGSDPVCLIEDSGVSHFDWLDRTHVVVWVYQQAEDETQTGYFALVDDLTGGRNDFCEGLFQHDGHCNFSPDREWMLTDTYPQGPRQEQSLMLFHPKSHERIDIAAFAAVSVADPSWRCDLHPRWNRDGTKVCIDSTHDGSRQMYVVDVEEICGRDESDRRNNQ